MNKSVQKLVLKTNKYLVGKGFVLWKISHCQDFVNDEKLLLGLEKCHSAINRQTLFGNNTEDLCPLLFRLEDRRTFVKESIKQLWETIQTYFKGYVLKPGNFMFSITFLLKLFLKTDNS